jgi:predicted RND superfamily exporter protein
MFDSLARLAQRHRLAVVLTAVVLFGAAGAAGSSVADRLDPYGADDPDTESVIADQKLEEAGFRDAGVLVLIEDAPPRTAEGRDQIRSVSEELAADPDVDRVVGYLDTRSPDFLSRDRTATYLAVSLEPTDTPWPRSR